MEHKFKKSNAEVRTVKAIQFGVMSPDFLRNISVTQQMEFAGKEISKGICNDQTAGGLPNLGAINDPRMGNVNDPEHPGYVGHIELVRPIYHIGFIKIVLDILRCVSYYTSELLVSRDNYANKKGRRNLKEITKLAKNIKKCPITQKKLPMYTYVREGCKIIVDFGNGKEIISPSKVREILEKISDEDVRIMGINTTHTRPEWMISTTLCVPPPHVRPSVFMSSSQKCEDDLTTKLMEIVKSNTGLANEIEKHNLNQSEGKEINISLCESYLQYNVNTFMDNQHPGQTPSLQRSGKPLKTLKERLSGKEGRIRGNLMGKRVNYSARTVITADPNLSLDQVGVPKAIALNLTIPETVTDYNMEYLLELVKRGPDIHPGAKFLTKNGGVKLDLRIAEVTELKNGWVVDRHLSDGDEIIFNRQPSLHKLSIMGHKTKILEGSTFRLNLAYTGAYNADFDGDEMNMNVPQSLTARAEVEGLMMVDKMIVSPQSNKPVIGIIQDSLLSCCKMTRRRVFIKKDFFMNMTMLLDNWNRIIPPPAIVKNGVEYWTGKQFFSLMLPPTLVINNIRDTMNPHDAGIMIKKGIMLSGSVDKAVIGKSQGGIIHILFNDFGPGTTKVFINQVQKISNYWIKQFGFTVGVGDAVASDYTVNEVNKILENTKTEIKELIANEGVSKDSRVIEELINSKLNAAVSEAGKIAEENLNFKNNFKATVSAGSKGSPINISQIMAVVGQQNVEGRRINYGFKHRTLPHYQKYDVGQESRGFVENNYLKGLTPQEFFFHAMAGREGLIDTACKSVSGDTEIVILNNNTVKIVKIGQWIDDYMETHKEFVEHRPLQQNTEVIDFLDSEQFFMSTADNHGVTSWGRVTHLTRHDPGEYVYEVKTLSGRFIKVVESKSLLVHNQDTGLFEPRLTSQINIGDCVPVIKTLHLPHLPHLPLIGTKESTNAKFKKYTVDMGVPDYILVADEDTIANVVALHFHSNKSVVSGSLDFIHRLNHLCSRLGIFGTFGHANGLYSLTVADDYDQQCDVVLDPIIGIVRLDRSDYPKVYDVTIPSTDNFAVLNGIVAKNTAEVGYVQRRLVKALEDVSVKYDNTVRNSRGVIIQYLYGEDGIDATYMENIHIRLLGYSAQNLYKEYYNTEYPEEFDTIKQLQQDLLDITGKRGQNNTKLDDDYFPMPVNVRRIVDYARNVKTDSNDRFTPKEAHAEIVAMCERISNIFTPHKELKEPIKWSEQHRSPDATKLFRIYAMSELATNKIRDLNKQQIYYAVQDIELKFRKALVNAGEVCGILAAQSIGELTTQLTLNSFHYAGVSAKNVTLGVPRLKELINVTKKLKTPSLTMYEKNVMKDISHDGQKRIIEGIRSSLEYKTIQDIINSSDIVMPDSDEYSCDDNIIDVYKTLYESAGVPLPDNFISLRLEFSAKELECVDTSLIGISTQLIQLVGNNNIRIICSDDNSVSADGKDNHFIRIICDDSDDKKEQLLTLRKIEIVCMSIKIKGCEGISKAYTREAKVCRWSPDKGHYKEPQWVLETEGTNLVETMSNENIDQSRTISNDILEIWNVLGIEAAREALLNELRTVLSFDGSYVNYRHLTILVDTMTCRGNLTSVTRHGINRCDVGALTKCSFEETLEVLMDAAAFGEIDMLKGISDNIMLGQTIPVGTGCMEIIYDADMEPYTQLGGTSGASGGVDVNVCKPMITPMYVPSKPSYSPLSPWVY